MQTVIAFVSGMIVMDILWARGPNKKKLFSLGGVKSLGKPDFVLEVISPF